MGIIVGGKTIDSYDSQEIERIVNGYGLNSLPDNISDKVNHPSHYTHGRFEVIDIIEDVTTGLSGIDAVCVANVVKYVCRHQYKNGVEDLKKARWYLDRLIKHMDNKC